LKKSVPFLLFRGLPTNILYQCAERFYGIEPKNHGVEYEEESDDDIESSIQKEVASMSSQKKSLKPFTPVSIDLPCVIFFKTRPPIDPVDFVSRICKEIVSTPGIRRMRYVNRLTPVSIIGKATEKGLEELGNIVLAQHFVLSDAEEKPEDFHVAPSVSGPFFPALGSFNELATGTQ
jgi:tRNA acetyltransferase TAN1